MELSRESDWVKPTGSATKATPASRSGNSAWRKYFSRRRAGAGTRRSANSLPPGIAFQRPGTRSGSAGGVRRVAATESARPQGAQQSRFHASDLGTPAGSGARVPPRARTPAGPGAALRQPGEIAGAAAQHGRGNRDLRPGARARARCGIVRPAPRNRCGCVYPPLAGSLGGRDVRQLSRPRSTRTSGSCNTTCRASSKRC